MLKYIHFNFNLGVRFLCDKSKIVVESCNVIDVQVHIIASYWQVINTQLFTKCYINEWVTNISNAEITWDGHVFLL